MRYGLQREFMGCDWFFERCREIQEAPDGHLDLWSREHGKSLCITIGKTIQDILANPEITIGIFSHTRPMAKSFLRVIQQEFETNELLKSWFPKVLWADPKKESPLWSLDGGIVVKRNGNPPEATVEAHGLVDGQPTGRHFELRVYDDVVTRDSVSTPEQIKKTNEALELSFNLGKIGGKMRMIGTRYAKGDTYEEFIKRGTVEPRIHSATDDGTLDGNPVFFPREIWEQKLRDMSPASIASQMMQNPRASDNMIFDTQDFQLWDADKELPVFDAIYQSLDGAFSIKQTADFSCLMTFGVFKLADKSEYHVMILDCLLERMAYPDLRDECIRQYQNKFGANNKNIDAIIIEDKASGSALIPDLRRANINVIGYNPGGLDKIGRAHLASPFIRAGKLWIPESRKRKGYPMSWLNVWHEQMSYFPNVDHDDGVDCFCQAILVLNRNGFLIGAKAPERQVSYWKKIGVGSYG